MSKELLNFLKSWLKWVENGAEAGKPYSREHGLCFNYVLHHSPRDTKELNRLFSSQGLGDTHPFGKTEYVHGFRNKGQHLDQNRINWVKAQIANAEGN